MQKACDDSVKELRREINGHYQDLGREIDVHYKGLRREMEGHYNGLKLLVIVDTIFIVFVMFMVCIILRQEPTSGDASFQDEKNHLKIQIAQGRRFKIKRLAIGG
ncbi:hypothetical protein L1049_022655 [Liquidambar formosana]|uniref:Uncharacterized protein n=1 Tax=Liquidambar formosana TaxID=63359 RepID=A0AAP0RCV4_LIQFO